MGETNTLTVSKVVVKRSVIIQALVYYYSFPVMILEAAIVYYTVTGSAYQLLMRLWWLDLKNVARLLADQT